MENTLETTDSSYNVLCARYDSLEYVLFT